MEEKIYYLRDQTEDNMKEWILGLNASGYAGILPSGMLVDRREFPKAFPVQKNTMFGVVEPKPLPK